MNKRLFRSRNDRMLCGVCGGIAEYLEVDPTLTRLIFAVSACAVGSGLLIYLFAALIIPNEPEGY